MGAAAGAVRSPWFRDGTVRDGKARVAQEAPKARASQGERRKPAPERPQAAGGRPGQGAGAREALRYPLPLKIHKRKVQLQLDLRLPVWQGGKPKAGAVFAQIAEAENPEGSKMKWDEAVFFKLGPPDIAQVVLGVRRNQLPVDLVHRSDRGGVEKTTRWILDRGQQAGTYKLTLSQSVKGSDTKALRVIYLNGADMYLFLQYLEASLPRLWNF